MDSKIPVKPVQPNQSIENAVACLFELTSAGDPVGCVEMPIAWVWNDPAVIQEVGAIVADISRKINSTPSTPSNGGR